VVLACVVNCVALYASLTNPLELGFEVGEVLALGDAGIVVSVVILLHAVRQVRRPNARSPSQCRARSPDHPRAVHAGACR
jgi:hypothetical protein